MGPLSPVGQSHVPYTCWAEAHVGALLPTGHSAQGRLRGALGPCSLRPQVPPPCGLTPGHASVLSSVQTPAMFLPQTLLFLGRQLRHGENEPD